MINVRLLHYEIFTNTNYKQQSLFSDGLKMIFHFRSLAVLGISSLILVDCAAELKTEANLQSKSSAIQVAQLPAAHARYVKRSSISSAAGSIKSVPSAIQLLERRGQKWTVEEQARLVELREKGLSWSELVDSFPERSWKTLRNRYYKITKDPSAPKKRRGRFWTPEEDELLLELAAMGKSWVEIAESLPGRTPSAVKGRYHSIPRQDPQAPIEKRKRYTAEEDDIIFKALEEGRSIEETSQLLERSTYSVHVRIAKLRKLYPLHPALTSLKPDQFTVAELELAGDLRERGLTWNQIQSEYFPTRNLMSLNRRYKKYERERGRGVTEE